MNHSIRTRIAVAIVALLLFVLGTSFVVNNVFLEKYYMVQKERSLIKVYTLINSYGLPNSYQEDDFRNNLELLCNRYNIRLVISDEEMNPALWCVNSDQDKSLLAGRLFAYHYGVSSFDKDVLIKTDNYTVQKIQDPFNEQEYLEIWGGLDNNYNFIMRLALDSIWDSVKISNEFFTYFTIAGVAFGIILAVWLSKQITRPIQELTDLSKRMANLDFEAKYTRGGNDEIAQLGDHFNRMSDKLQETISELKTANNELQSDIEKKEQIDQMRKEFLSNVSHELKTPIALIQGYAEGLKECINDDPESREFYCEVIMDESSKMNHMVKKLLTLNQLEFGNDVVTMERFDLVSLVRGVIQSASILAQQKEAKILFNEEEPVYVWADEFKVEEVVTNYISNALNHLEGDKVIDVKLIHKPDNVIRTTVFNTGKPIPEKDLDKIWIKFYKVDKARTREYGGSGIGLSIVKAIMDSFHQKCGVRNYDNGVEFWFELDGGEKCGNSGKDGQRLLPGPEQG